MEIDRIRMQFLDSEKFDDEHSRSSFPRGIILIYFYVNIILYIYSFWDSYVAFY